MMLACFETTLGWRNVLKRTVHETYADNGLGLAAQVADYLFLSLFPALLFVLAPASIIPGFDLVARATAALAGIVSAELTNVVREELSNVVEGIHGRLLSTWGRGRAVEQLVGDGCAN
jgi:membrane protein